MNCKSIQSQFNARRQRGIVLVTAILILLTLTLLGVASMSSTSMQERMAGNARLQAMAFEAASSGVSNSLNYVLDQFENNLAGLPDDQCGALNHDGWVNGSGEPIATDWNQPVVKDGGGQYLQRMYCLSCDPADPTCGQPRSQLFVETRGEALVGNQVVASREIEVRIDLIGDFTSGDGCSAMCLPGFSPGPFAFPNGNAFTVAGPPGSPSITVSNDAMRDAVLDGIRDDRIGNYGGGVAVTEMGSPWNDADALAAFLAWVEFGATLNDSAFNSSVSVNGDQTFGTSASPQITFVNGDLTVKGGISGAGIMVIQGNLEMRGTPQFDGLLVILGGGFVSKGGGSGGNHAGSMVIMNADGTSIDLGEVSADFNGGGNAQFTFSCEVLNQMRDELLIPLNPGDIDPANPPAGMSQDEAQRLVDQLPSDPEFSSEEIWIPECNLAPANLVEADAELLRIVSWRENIGWREESDFAGAGL